MNVRTPLCDTELRESAVWPITPNSKFVCVRVCVCVCVSETCNWALWRSVSLCSYSPLLVVVVFFPTYIFFLVFQNGLPALLLLSAGWSEAGILINQTLRTWNGHYPLCVCCHSAVLSSAPPFYFHLSLSSEYRKRWFEVLEDSGSSRVCCADIYSNVTGQIQMCVSTGTRWEVFALNAVCYQNLTVSPRDKVEQWLNVSCTHFVYV